MQRLAIRKDILENAVTSNEESVGGESAEWNLEILESHFRNKNPN